MPLLALTPLASPLRVDESGTVRVGNTRVTLDTLIGCYRDGNTAEEIVQQFPSLRLADVHATIAYFLSHRSEVEAYLLDRNSQALELRREVEFQSDQNGIRERLLAREANRKHGR